MKKRIELAAIASLAILAGSTPARAQAVEIFAGDDAVTVDVMFFNYFKDGAGQPSPVLLFHRSRALVDYDIDSSSRRNLPQFVMTNAVSYNPKALRGLHSERRENGLMKIAFIGYGIGAGLAWVSQVGAFVCYGAIALYFVLPHSMRGAMLRGQTRP